MSKTEQDLDAGADAEFALDPVEVDTVEADAALDDALVESIENYTLPALDDEPDTAASNGDDGDGSGGSDDSGTVDVDVSAPDSSGELAVVETDTDALDPSGELPSPNGSGGLDRPSADALVDETPAGTIVAPVDDDETLDEPVEVEPVDGVIAAEEDEADATPFTLPPIVMATEVDDADVADEVVEVDEDVSGELALDASVAPELHAPPISPDILEELRRADIDGPLVEMAPQDDTTSARRRPKRPIDYDPAPVPIPLRVPRILGRKPRVRKVTRVVRHVDPWSVFKIAIIANIVLYLILLTAGVLLWNVAYATGTIDNVERFFESFGWQSFEFNGGEIYHSAWIAGLFLVLGLTGLTVLAATLFNLITDLVGGVRFTVLEEEVVESRTSPMRRFVVRRAEPDIPAVTQDSSGSIIREAVVDDTGDLPR